MLPESPTTRTFALSIAPIAAIMLRESTLLTCLHSKDGTCPQNRGIFVYIALFRR